MTDAEERYRSILVTGSTGTVGARVVRELLARDVAVRAAVRPGRTVQRSSGAAAAGPAAPVEFDFEDPATFSAALEGVSAVFLMRPPHLSDGNAMRPFIDAMRDAGVGHVVFLSVQGAGTNPFVPHHTIERLLKRSGLSWTFLRPSFFMENLSGTHVADIRERGEIYVPAGNGRTNFIAARDIGEAAAVCLTTTGHAGKAYEITGSEALTYAQVARILSDATGREITYPQPSAKQFAARMREAGHDDEFISVTRKIYAIAKFGMAAGTTTEFQALVGRPPLTFEQWARENAGSFAPDAT